MRFMLRRIRAAGVCVVLLLFAAPGERADAQTTWEFSGTPYAYQKAHFDSATRVIRDALGIQMRTFGAPYNQIDTTFLRVMSEDTSYKVLLLGQLDPAPASGQINLKNRVFIESATGVPDYSYFLTSWYAKKGIHTDYMVMQGHPYAWTSPAARMEFQNIVNFLIATDSVVFTTPYGYYRYLTDTTIARTPKIQVILKLDDLRATSSYFYPCLPTYEFLIASGVKASVGVNKMEGLTQAQIDTILYFTSRTDSLGEPLMEIWNHGLDHSMTSGSTGGNWSSPDTWPDGYVPTPAVDAVIPAGMTITLDTMGAVCNNLIINGTLVASNTTATSLTVHGDVTINTGGSFTSPSLTGGTANIIHMLALHGDFTNAGGTFDFRLGSAGTTMRVINTTFTGNGNSTITVGPYSSSNNCFNSITVNKSGGARVICASDVVCDQGSSACRSQLILTEGVVETGSFAIFSLSTTSTDLITPSPASYILGALGRGMANSGGKSNLFPVGDERGYRPITVRSTSAGVASGHHIIVRCIPGDANTGSSTFGGGIDAVSGVRYYEVGYGRGIGAGADSMTVDRFAPTYGTDDGVAAGNTDLRVAVSTDGRASWQSCGPAANSHTTSLASPPTQIMPDSLVPPVVLHSGVNMVHVALADVTGGANPLERSTVITATAGGGGSIAPAGIVMVVLGADQTFAITPAALYEVDTLLVDEAPVPPAVSYTFINATEAHSIRAVFRLAGAATINVPVAGGWNLISNPVTDPVPGDSLTQMFPTTLVPYAFAFTASAGYVQHVVLANGTGYWGKFPSPTSQPVTGSTRFVDSLHVSAGWNIVGTISCPVDTQTILSSPEGLRASDWFGFAGGYAPATQLLPGRGYWVKAHGPGVFVIACAPPGPAGVQPAGVGRGVGRTP